MGGSPPSTHQLAGPAGEQALVSTLVFCWDQLPDGHQGKSHYNGITGNEAKP